MGAAVRPMLKAVAAAGACVLAIAALEVIAVAGIGFLIHGDLSKLVAAPSVLKRARPHRCRHRAASETIVDGFAMFLAHRCSARARRLYERSDLGDRRAAGHSFDAVLAARGNRCDRLCGVCTAALRLFFDSIRHRGDRTALLLVLVLGAIGTMSMAHEMLYQRAFWLLLGAILAMPLSIRSPSIAPGRAATV